MSRWTHALAPLFALALAGTALAQQNPPADDDGGVSVRGAAVASAGEVPLALPGERDGLPVPVSILGSGGVGSVGPGWDVPLSTVSLNRTFSRNRPLLTATNGPPALNDARGPRVSFGGRSIAFLRVSGEIYRAQVGHQAMELRWINPTSSWELDDGDGLRYRFEHLPGLDAGWPWFLVEIASQRHAASSVRLSYQVTPGAAPEILLTQVRYNFDATGACAKHAVNLTYAAPQPPDTLGDGSADPPPTQLVLGIAVLDGKVVLRARFLSRLEVTARGGDCATPELPIGRYRFRYAPDADTGARRLVAVDVAGRPGLPSGDDWRPVSRWVYGRATSTTAGYPQLQYARKASIPIGALDFGINGVSAGNLDDFDGDGLPDLVSDHRWARNVGGAGFAAVQQMPSSPPLPLPGGMFASGQRGTYRPSPAPAVEEATTREIDFNGDGKTDRLAAGANTWTVYLNEPTGWRAVSLPMQNVRAGLIALGHQVAAERLALGRNVTGYSYQDTGCLIPSGQSWVPCPSTVHTFTRVREAETTRTEWKLADVNGDGYPDLVATTRQARVTAGPPPSPSFACLNPTPDPLLHPAVDPVAWGEWTGSGSDPRRECERGDWQFGWVRPGATPGTLERVGSTEIAVFYNRAGVQLTSSASPFADAVILEGSLSASGLGMWRARTAPTRYFAEGSRVFDGFAIVGNDEVGGLLDVTGDGLADLLGDGAARVGTGTGFVDVGLTDFPAVIRTTANDFWEACLLHPGAHGWKTQVTAGYVDLDGDGVVDYLAAGKIRFGRGTQLASPKGIVAPEPLVLSERSGSCSFPVQNKVAAGAWDVDGDGRLEQVREVGGNLEIASILEPGSGWGAPAARQIVEVDNGYGAVTHIRYESQKSDLTTAHAVPFPEIRIAERWVTRRNGAPGEALVPTRFAYGGASLFFDHAADRWTFPGYERVVAISGTPGDKGLDGQAKITDALRASDLTGYARSVLVGSPRFVYRLAGTIPADPRALLLVEPYNHGGWKETTATVWDARSMALPGASADDCALAPQPWGGLGAALERPCRLVGFPYAKQVNRRVGEGAFFMARYTETETEVVAIDDLGRPTTIRHAGDVTKTSDDLCEALVYASPTGAAWPVRGALAAQWLREPTPNGKEAPLCRDRNQALAGVRFRYDHLPEGSVGVGRLSHEIRERRDGAGQLLDEWTASTRYHDAQGNLVTLVDDSGLRIDLAQRDAFALYAARRTVSAPDVPIPFVDTVQVDPNTLAVTQTTSANGLISRSQYDGRGRPVQSSFIDPADHLEYIASRTDYQGETTVVDVGPPQASSAPVSDAYDPLGRRTLVRTWNEDVTVASVPPSATAPTRAETWSYHHVDHLGRAVRDEALLGEDYGGVHLVVAETLYDPLGRVAFTAAPRVDGVAALASFGTSFTYDPDGRQRCAILGKGFQVEETTSLADARFVTCQTQHFFAGTRLISQRGPLEMDATSTVAEASDEMVFDAVGRPQRHTRYDGDRPLERMDYVADRLGRPTIVTRHRDPALGSVGPTWITSHDSLDRVVSYMEPGHAERFLVHDRAGNLVETWWLDAGVRHSVRQRYDGMGRVLSSSEITAGFEDPESVVTYFYDFPSGEPYDQGGPYTRGRLTHAHSARQSVYLGYDSRGRAAFTTWRGDDGDERVERELRFRGNGQLAEVRLRLPDTGYRDEVASYRYDSAQRLIGVGWRDENGSLELLDVRAVDPFGRPRKVVYGNGVTEGLRYRDAERDELLERSLSASNGARHASFSYDAALRLLERFDQSTVGAGRDEVDLLAYDAVGHLASRVTRDRPTSIRRVNERYTYDPLGNRVTVVDAVAHRDQSVTLDPLDADRICAVTGPGFPISRGCQFVYDASGNVVEAPLTESSWQRFTYDNRGRIRRLSVVPDGSEARWDYDPFGEVAALEVDGVVAPRRELRFGDAAARLDLDGRKTYERKIPGPEGTLATKRGSGKSASWLYWHRDQNGARAFSDDDGDLVQEVDYASFGETRTLSGTPGTFDYTTFQWNEGDSLAELGVTQLGARLYDARLGRFLERDPLIHPFSSTKGHPYAFAWSDPVNFADPSGLCTEGVPTPACGGGLAFGIGVGLAVLDWVTDGAGDDDGDQPAATGPTFPSRKPYLVVGGPSPEMTVNLACTLLEACRDYRSGMTAGEKLDRDIPIRPAIRHTGSAFEDLFAGELLDAWANGSAASGEILALAGLFPEGRVASALERGAGRAGRLGSRAWRWVRGAEKEMGPIFEHLPTPRAPFAGRLTALGGGAWESPGGLRYGPGSKQGNRVKHVLEHAVNNPTRAGEHGVFNGGPKAVIATIDEAYALAKARGPGVKMEQQGIRTVFTVDMGRNVGWVGGQGGAAQAHPAASHIRLVLEGTDVITAFPLIP